MKTKTSLLIRLLILYLGLCQITSVTANNSLINENYFPPPQYSSPSVVLMEAATGMVLYESNGREMMYPASITKIMTALVVLEQIEDLEERITFSDRSIWGIDRSSSHIAMDVGETLSVYEALYAIMLPSANEVSMALAEHVAGTVEAFVDLMNRRANTIGAHDTYFVNPSGLPGAGHVTTAYDFALIMREAVRHPMFVDIIGARRFDIPPTERQPEVRSLLNTNRLIQPGQYFNQSVVGSKTGWTTAAGHTLVTYGQQDGRRLIVSVLGGTSPATFTDTTALLDFGFSLPFQPTQIFDAAANVPTVPVYQVENGTRTEIGRVALQAQENIYYDLPQGFDMSTLRFNLSVPHALVAPVAAGDNLGAVTIYVQNMRLGRAPLFATEDMGYAAPTAYVPETPLYTMAAYSPTMYPIPDEYPTPAPYEPSGGYPTPSLWQSEYLLLFAVPLAISLITLLVSLVIFIAGRRGRMRRSLHMRYARYPHYYRYK